MNIWDKVVVEDVTDPCTGKCCVSSTTGYCDTCGLSIKESHEWKDSSNETKSEILKKIEKRKISL